VTRGAVTVHTGTAEKKEEAKEEKKEGKKGKKGKKGKDLFRKDLFLKVFDLEILQICGERRQNVTSVATISLYSTQIIWYVSQEMKT